MKEVEVKVALDDVTSWRSKFENANFNFVSDTKQDDRIFLPPGFNYDGIVPGTPVIRVRSEDDKKFTLTLKKKLVNELDKIEIELVINDPEQAAELIRGVGYKEILRIKKHRIKFKKDDIELCLDEVEELGGFVEVERMVENNADSTVIQAQLLELLSDMSVDIGRRTPKGYDSLLYEKIKL